MDIVERLRATEMRDTGYELGGIPIEKLTRINPDGPEAADEIELLRKERDGLREALHMIVCNTEPDAIKHRNYDHLAKNIHDCASAALKEKP